MSNSMTLTALIISKTSTKNYVDGTASYRPNTNKYKHFDFKLFEGSNKDIQSFVEGDLVWLSGKFTYRKGCNTNPMFVCL
jgi:hypothetical protein